MKKRLLKTVMSAVIAFAAICSSIMTAFAAPAKITVSEDEYNVYVSDFPSDFGAVYAKFNSNKSNIESYELEIWDDFESEEVMTGAFTKSGLKPDDYTMFSMSMTLYQEDTSDGEMYPVTSSNPMTLIFELPGEFEGVEDKLKIYALKTDGKVEPVPYTLVEVDDYICAQLTVSRFTQYSFAVSNADIAAYEAAEYGDDSGSATAAPTKAPTAPTAAATKAPTAAPTKTASSSQASSSSSSSSSGVKDSVPTTGDEFSNIAAGIKLILAGAALSGVLIYLKKK